MQWVTWPDKALWKFNWLTISARMVPPRFAPESMGLKPLFVSPRVDFRDLFLRGIPWGSKLLHACRKLSGNYFSGFQVIITCMITCRKFLGNFFSAISGNFAFYYLCRIFLLPEMTPKFKNYLGENFPLYWPSPPALSSSFLLRVVCRLAWMHNESVMNAQCITRTWCETQTPRICENNNEPLPPKKKYSTFCTSSGRGGGVQSFTQRSARRVLTWGRSLSTIGFLIQANFMHTV